MAREDKESINQELTSLKNRLAKINKKVKTSLDSPVLPSQKPENKNTRLTTVPKEISLEEIHEKLRLINDYLRKREIKKDILAVPSLKTQLKEEPAKEEMVTAEEPFNEESSNISIPRLNEPQEEAALERLGVGMDLGTSYIVAARELLQKNVFIRSERNAFLSVRPDKITRDLMDKLRIKYVSVNDKMYVLGRSALDLANIFNREMQRTMSQGILNPSEAEGVPILKLLIQHIIWPVRKPKEVCCFSIPAAPIDRDQDTVYHRSIFEGILKACDFEPMFIDEGYAVVLAELGNQDFTGIGISCGAGLVNICAAFRSVPILSFSISRGGDWIDKSAASVLGVPSSRVTAVKEESWNLKQPVGREQEAIAIYYRDFIHYFLKNMAEVFAKSANAPEFNKPVEVVLAGGSAMVGGFLDVVNEELKSIDLGISIAKIRLADDPFTTVCRGCLFYAIYSGDFYQK